MTTNQEPRDNSITIELRPSDPLWGGGEPLVGYKFYLYDGVMHFCYAYDHNANGVSNGTSYAGHQKFDSFDPNSNGNITLTLDGKPITTIVHDSELKKELDSKNITFEEYISAYATLVGTYHDLDFSDKAVRDTISDIAMGKLYTEQNHYFDLIGAPASPLSPAIITTQDLGQMLETTFPGNTKEVAIAKTALHELIGAVKDGDISSDRFKDIIYTIGYTISDLGNIETLKSEPDKIAGIVSMVLNDYLKRDDLQSQIQHDVELELPTDEITQQTHKRTVKGR